MKKLLWWILGILLSPIALFLILTVLIRSEERRVGKEC